MTTAVQPTNTIDLLTLNEAAKILGCAPRTVGTYAQQGLIPRVKLGSLVRIDRRDLEAFIESRKQRA